MEKFAPFLAEAARLRGASRASVRSLQEQDKLIVSLQEKSKQLENEVVRLKQLSRDTDSLESKLLDTEAENSRLQKVCFYASCDFDCMVNMSDCGGRGPEAEIGSGGTYCFLQLQCNACSR